MLRLREPLRKRATASRSLGVLLHGRQHEGFGRTREDLRRYRLHSLAGAQRVAALQHVCGRRRGGRYRLASGWWANGFIFALTSSSSFVGGSGSGRILRKLSAKLFFSGIVAFLMTPTELLPPRSPAIRAMP